MARPALEPPPIPPIPEDDFEDRYAEWGGQSRGTKPEFIVWEWLVKRMKFKEGLDFNFQSSRWGGRMTFGGVVVDFWFPMYNMVWRVMGEHFHLVEPTDRMNDAVQKLALVASGLTVIDLWVQDLEQRPAYVLELAMRGIEAPTHWNLLWGT